MSRTKHIKIAEAQNLPCIFDYLLSDCKKAISDFTANSPLVIELGCGDGRYASSMAQMFSNKKFIGVDIQGERLWMGAKILDEKKINNVRFLRAHIEHLEQFFTKHSVDEIWLTFSDPYPRKKNAGKRLSNPHFLKIYQNILKPGGILHLKTDNDGLFDYSVEAVSEFGGKIGVCLQNVDSYIMKYPLLGIQTFFEEKQRKSGKQIHYLNCTL